eukprot:gene8008-8868_t
MESSSGIDGNVGIVTFMADYDYVPQVEGEIKLRVGDLCVVAKPILDPCGWLEGTNKSSNEYGQFPGTYVSIVEDYTPPPPPPPRPPKPIGPRGTSVPAKEKENQVDWSSVVINNHKLERNVFKKPVFCEQCQDYIWGHNVACFWCSECFLASHVGCSFVFNGKDCDPDRKYAFEYDKDDLLQPVEHWGNTDVLVWLVAIRAYQYIHTFKMRNITGGMLYDIDERYLKKTMAIPHDFDVRSISNAIRELLHGTDKLTSSTILPQSVPIPEENFADSFRDSIISHRLYEHTFTTVQGCDVCGKGMFGLVRQGFICNGCGIQCHRHCAQYGLRACKKTYFRARRSSDATDPSFGTALHQESTDIPVCIQKLVQFVEDKAKQTQNIYLNAVPFLEILSLRNALNQAPGGVNMKDTDWRDPNIAASVLKQYLLEMPASVIVPEKYEDFKVAANLSLINHDHQLIQRQIRELPKQNQIVLEYLQSHLLRVCNIDNKLDLEKICQVFGVLLLRPFESEARKFIKNIDVHSRIMELLLSKRLTASNTPIVPDRRPTLVRELMPDGIETAEWEMASEKLKDTRDGTFLVRDSQEKGEYTLTLRKDGGNKLIRIYHKDGQYGFTDWTLFPSLSALINHFCSHSLKEYNSNLDMKLLYPVSKYENVSEVSLTELEEEFDQINRKMGQYTTLENALNDAAKEVEDVKVLLQGQTEVVYLLEEHVLLATGYCGEVSPNDRVMLQETIQRMNLRLEEEKKALKETDMLLRQKNEEYSVMENYLNDMKCDMPQTKQRYSELQRKIKDRSPDREVYFTEKEDEGIYDELPALVRDNKRDELPKETWMMGKVNRETVRILLNGKPDGTFFVRESGRRRNEFVISLVHDQSIKHITIEKGPNGYGFAEPYNIYPDFSSLIHHYHKQSLRMHNPKLDAFMPPSPQDIKSRLDKVVDQEGNVLDMGTVLDIVSVLERITITKEALETTRLGRVINLMRKKTDNEELAKRAKKLVKKWQKLVSNHFKNLSRSTDSPGNGSRVSTPVPQINGIVKEQGNFQGNKTSTNEGQIKLGRKRKHPGYSNESSPKNLEVTKCTESNITEDSSPTLHNDLENSNESVVEKYDYNDDIMKNGKCNSDVEKTEIEKLITGDELLPGVSRLKSSNDKSVTVDLNDENISARKDDMNHNETNIKINEIIVNPQPKSSAEEPSEISEEDLQVKRKEFTSDNCDDISLEADGINGCFDETDTWCSWSDPVITNQGKLTIYPYVTLD